MFPCKDILYIQGNLYMQMILHLSIILNHSDPMI